jgi:hypothetical protein
MYFLPSILQSTAPLDFCGNLSQTVSMSQSIRLSDELIAEARSRAKLYHRSPPQQIEHWAAIGRVMEVALAFPAEEKVVRAVGRRQLDEALAEVGTPAGIERAQKVIRESSARSR